MVRRDADERANLQAQLAATAQRVQLQQEQMKSQHQAAAEQMQLQQQAAEEKLRQAELLAEEKRQRTLLEFQLQQLQSTTTIQTTHSQAHDDRPHIHHCSLAVCSLAQNPVRYLPIIYHSQGLLYHSRCHIHLLTWAITLLRRTYRHLLYIPAGPQRI